MKEIKKTALKTLVDYVITLLFCIFGVLFFGWMLYLSWGQLAYSGLMCFLLFGLIYARLHRVGGRDANRPAEEQPSLWFGLQPTLPLAGGLLILALFYWLLEINVLPWGNAIMRTVYVFPDFAPRVAEHVFLMDYITPIIRFIFAPAAGFMQQTTTALALVIVPGLILLGGFLGYVAGRKRFFFGVHVFKAEKKLHDKFNE